MTDPGRTWDDLVGEPFEFGLAALITVPALVILRMIDIHGR